MSKSVKWMVAALVLLIATGYFGWTRITEQRNIASYRGNTQQPNGTGTAGVPSPLVKYSTIDEARKAVGFDFAVPSSIPEGYQLRDIVVVDKRLAETFYWKGTARILYRTAKGSADISGDYNVYERVRTVTVEGIPVTVKGKGDVVNLALWVKDGISYSLSFGEGTSEQALATMMKSVK